MSKIKFDLDTAKWIADKAQNDRSVFPVGFIECEKCGAAYIPSLGHNCRNVIEIDFREPVEVEHEGFQRDNE